MRARTRRPTPESLEFRSLLSVVGTTATNLAASAIPTEGAPAAETSYQLEYAAHATSAERDSIARSGSETDSTTTRSTTTGGPESESDSSSSPSASRATQTASIAGTSSSTTSLDDDAARSTTGSSSSPTGQVRDSGDDGSESLGAKSGGGTTPTGSVPTTSGEDDGSADSGDDSEENAAPPPTSTPPSSGSTGSTDDGSSDDGKSGMPVGGTATPPSNPAAGNSDSGPTGPPIPPPSTPIVTQPVDPSGHGSSTGEPVSVTSPGTEPSGVKPTSHSTTSGTEPAAAVSSDEPHTGSGAAVPVSIGGGTSRDARVAATSGDEATAASSSGLSARGAGSHAGALGSPAGSLPVDALPPSEDDGPRAAGAPSGGSDAGSTAQPPPIAEASARAETLQSRAADLIASCSPFDRQAVERAIDQFLNQLGDIEGVFAQPGSSAALIPSVIATAVVLTASETVRRRLSRAADDSTGGERRIVFPALPGLNQRWALEEL
jgi:hypothetical protein